MASAINIEKLIADKKIELAEEKLVLGLSSPGNDCQVSNGDKEGINGCNSLEKQISFASAVENDFKPEETKEEHSERPEDLDETIPADLERYIRQSILIYAHTDGQWEANAQSGKRDVSPLAGQAEALLRKS
ncbi:hypothetical protein ACJJTC_003737 [Scirpophaga incertulas]